MIAIWPQKENPKKNTDGNRIHTGKPHYCVKIWKSHSYGKTVCAKQCKPTSFFSRENWRQKAKLKIIFKKGSDFGGVQSPKVRNKYRHIFIFILSV